MFEIEWSAQVLNRFLERAMQALLLGEYDKPRYGWAMVYPGSIPVVTVRGTLTP